MCADSRFSLEACLRWGELRLTGLWVYGFPGIISVCYGLSNFFFEGMLDLSLLGVTIPERFPHLLDWYKKTRLVTCDESR